MTVAFIWEMSGRHQMVANLGLKFVTKHNGQVRAILVISKYQTFGSLINLTILLLSFITL